MDRTGRVGLPGVTDDYPPTIQKCTEANRLTNTVRAVYKLLPTWTTLSTDTTVWDANRIQCHVFQPRLIIPEIVSDYT